MCGAGVGPSLNDLAVDGTLNTTLKLSVFSFCMKDIINAEMWA